MALSAALIGPTEPPAVESLNPDGKASVLLICDHASCRVPAGLANLGLDETALCQHIAWDIGAAEVTRHLSKLLDAPALLTGYSRLVIDCNRQPGHPQSIPDASDGTAIPANRGLDEKQQEARVEAFFRPYHNAVTATLAHLWRRGPAPALFSVHSFTPSLGGVARPWDAGVLWNRDPRIALPLIERLGNEANLTIGDNLPYSGRDLAYSLNRHASAAGLPNCAIEIRQDRVAGAAGVTFWAELLAKALKKILADPALHQARVY
jgi:predicted N-formylglutamate amidohydrolase